MFKRKTFDLFDVLAAVFSDKALINTPKGIKQTVSAQLVNIVEFEYENKIKAQYSFPPSDLVSVARSV